VKFYKRFPGDIQIKTGGLTLAEFGAYDRLLDHYYATEEPIAPDEVYSITRALTRADREAVDKVLGKFFDASPAGYTQQRADEMIAEAQPKIEAARTNGLKGGRPKSKPKQTERKPTGLSETTKDEPKSKTSQSQSSLSPSEKRTAQALSTKPDGVADGVWLDWLALRKAKNAPVTATVIEAAAAEAVKAGLPLGAFLRIWCLRGSQGLQADWIKPDERAKAVMHPLSFAEQATKAKEAKFREMAGSAYGALTGNTIDMEVPNGPALTRIA